MVTTLRDGRADLGLFVEGPDSSGLELLPFRSSELALLLPRSHRLAVSAAAIAFAELLQEDWIGLEGGASLLWQQQRDALAAGRPLKIRMQLGSFDAVCHVVAAGLGVALLPRDAVRPTSRALKLVARPLEDAWARRRLLVAQRAGQADAAIVALRDHLAEPSRNAKARAQKR